MPPNQTNSASAHVNDLERVRHDGGQPQEDDSFRVDLQQFEGPLDVLLDLIKRRRLDILEISVASVTEQYLESMRRAERLQIEVGAEFLMMAATLIHIKSKALLPTPPILDESHQDDPAADLVRDLIEREKFLQAAEMLESKRVVEESVWPAALSGVERRADGEPDRLEVTIFDLVQTFRDALERVRDEPTVDMEPETVSVASQIQYLRGLLEKAGGPIRIRPLLRTLRTVRAVVATFLALLELVKAQAVELQQEETFGEIVVRKHTQFDQTPGQDGSDADSDFEFGRPL